MRRATVDGYYLPSNCLHIELLFQWLYDDLPYQVASLGRLSGQLRTKTAVSSALLTDGKLCLVALFSKHL